MRNSRQSPLGHLGASAWACLLASIVCSTLLLGLVARTAWSPWFGFVALAPLFLAVRIVRPWHASLCGVVWGLSLFLIACLGLGLRIEPTFRSFILLLAAPAAYMGAGSALTRWIGFSPFVLGVGWMGVELALAPLGLHDGLLSGTQGETTLMIYVGRGLGYALVAFLVAYVNAVLVGVLPRLYTSGVSVLSHGLGDLPNTAAVAQPLGHVRRIIQDAVAPRGPPVVLPITSMPCECTRDTSSHVGISSCWKSKGAEQVGLARIIRNLDSWV